MIRLPAPRGCRLCHHRPCRGEITHRALKEPAGSRLREPRRRRREVSGRRLGRARRFRRPRARAGRSRPHRACLRSQTSRRCVRRGRRCPRLAERCVQIRPRSPARHARRDARAPFPPRAQAPRGATRAASVVRPTSSPLRSLPLNRMSLPVRSARKFPPMPRCSPRAAWSPSGPRENA